MTFTVPERVAELPQLVSGHLRESPFGTLLFVERCADAARLVGRLPWLPLSRAKAICLIWLKYCKSHIKFAITATNWGEFII